MADRGRAGAAALLLAGLAAEDPQVRCRATGGLARIHTLEVAQALAAALYDPEPFVRWGAAQALGEVARRATDRAVPVAVGQALLAAARAPDAGARAAAADAIASWGAQGPLEPLLALAQDPEAWVRAAAVRALGLAGSHAPEVVVPAIGRALEDPDPEVRRVATGAIAWCRDGLAPTLLRARLADPAATVRAAAVRALARVTSGEHEEDVLPLLSDPDATVRAEAVRFLRVWGTQRALEPLAALREDAAVVGDVPVSALAEEAHRYVGRRLRRWRGWLLRLWQRLRLGWGRR